ncbi:MAG: S8 family serine peptidase, partial [Actinomycetota bacterium]|nr:S8 family serine peptidase [Actinomycetota bacterium]
MRRAVVLLAALATALAVMVPASADPQDYEATPLTVESSFTSNVTKSGETIRVIVQLEDAPLASYEGDINGLPATSPKVTKQNLNMNSNAVRGYSAYLESRQSTFKGSLKVIAPSAKVSGDFQVALNGIAMSVTVEDAQRISKTDGVAAVMLDSLEQLDTETSPAFIGAPDTWTELGGQGSAGNGVVVGVLDTGIWPEHPSFADPSLVGGTYSAPATVPGSNGFGSGGARSTCDFGNLGFNPDDAVYTCNNKLIGAYSFLDTYKAVLGLTSTEFDSARDSNGHGTHTTSTAAGNGGVDATLLGIDRGTLSGIAPRAHVIMYR